MSGCSEELARQGKAYPRTCAVCGLGPCREAPPSPHIPGDATIEEEIANVVFPHVSDRQRRHDLAELLTVFAGRIRQSVET